MEAYIRNLSTQKVEDIDFYRCIWPSGSQKAYLETKKWLFTRGVGFVLFPRLNDIHEPNDRKIFLSLLVDCLNYPGAQEYNNEKIKLFQYVGYNRADALKDSIPSIDLAEMKENNHNSFVSAVFFEDGKGEKPLCLVYYRQQDREIFEKAIGEAIRAMDYTYNVLAAARKKPQVRRRKPDEPHV